MSDTSNRIPTNLFVEYNDIEVDELDKLAELAHLFRYGLIKQIATALLTELGWDVEKPSPQDDLMAAFRDHTPYGLIILLIENVELKSQVLNRIVENKELYQNILLAFSPNYHELEIAVANDITGEAKFTSAPSFYMNAKSEFSFDRKNLELIAKRFHKPDQQEFPLPDSSSKPSERNSYHTSEADVSVTHVDRYRLEDSLSDTYKHYTSKDRDSGVDFADSARSFLRKMVAHNQDVAGKYTDDEYLGVRLSGQGMDQLAVEKALEETARLIDGSNP